MSSVIEVRGLTRRFGDLLAVDHVDFAVEEGEIFGFLGPNGAGKTTTVRMLTGYISPSEGTALIDGHDIVRESTLARQHLGIVPEEANVYVDLTVWQNVMFMAELHGLARRQRRRRGRELLELFGLEDRINQKGRALSKGLRQRLMLCMALVSEPALLFLDEPTGGLDVASAQTIRELILRMNRQRRLTVFLTTHNIEEADQLSHRIAIINKGRIAAIDTPQSIRSTIESRSSVEVTFAGQGLEISELRGMGIEAEIAPITNGLRLYTPEPGQVAQEIAASARTKGLKIESIRTQGPTLEEVFLHITGTGRSSKKEPSDERLR